MARLPRLIALAACLLAGQAARAATPPAQPATGPGGVGDARVEIIKRAVGHASAVTYVFYGAGRPAAPRRVVVLLHAWGAVNPMVYGGWIDHLARNGYIVLFPSFQDVGKTRPPDATGLAAGLIADALAALGGDPDAKPDLDRLAYLGHSAGAGIAANLAAADTPGVPRPKLVLALMPGGIASDPAARGIPLADLSTIPASTTLVAMIGDREFAASDRLSRRILREATAVPPERKLLVRAPSDDHGFPALSATLSSVGSPNEKFDLAGIKVPPDPPLDPKAPRPQRPRWSADMVLTGEQTVLVNQLTRNVTDALDYLAYWRTFDAVADQTFGGGDLMPLKTNPSFLDMGRWSDGWPIRRLGAETPKAVTTPVVAREAPAPSKVPVAHNRRR